VREFTGWQVDRDFLFLNGCCLAVIAALLVVGTASHEVLRHFLQTSPLWIAIVLGIRRSAAAKWAALPCLFFWLFVMIVIWLFLLGWTRIITGTFSPIEIAMTLVVGAASLVGIWIALTIRSRIRPSWAAVTFLLVAVLQFAALRLSLLPSIAHR
jgi:hypothetical protein